ncbi:FAD-binding protein [Amantichitinum ursilacus]|uniref:Putative decaprenylphosphoryl-beta-D-ribose oxidase n=1 Tax=Amantichitinum ursilacus TaxID=857265 RepID=A0A0N0GR69_9NEIS|nr:FAD-binding protein [Amantichitinum ursilacus]KPC55391.1 putative decaprenylphosphoryl-beta-D-ribose oxidase [Amantichitinum ursilacus]
MTTVNDVTGLNRIPVFAITRPTSTEEVAAAVRSTTLPVSVGGGHFSMGGHTASPGSLHLDLRALNAILAFEPARALLRVQAGTRWCDIQRFIDPHGFAVKIMQTYANFTVGGALSVNAHGRYMGLGPVVSSVRALTLVLADGRIVVANRQQNAELFRAAIGGYGAIGIITEVELELASNRRVERQHKTLPVAQYRAWFDAHVEGRADVVFHNFDLYPPHYRHGRAVSWVHTDKPASAPRLQPLARRFWLARYLMWAITETPMGKLRRQHVYDPVLYLRKPVHWRNYEAGYDVAELEPLDRERRTYVLQEYFVPVARFEQFAAALGATLQAHRVNAVNVSVRHATGDDTTLLNWARGDTYAFVLYYKQRTRANAQERVAVWTRELIEHVLAAGGTYYLPYQLHATADQFHRAYPRARELFALKQQLDPDYRLRGALWDRYYAPQRQAEIQPASAPAQRPQLFAAVYDQTESADRFYRFLQNIFNVVPEDRLHTLIKQALTQHRDDEAIYRAIQSGLPAITPRLAALTHALPSLATQKQEMGRQTAQLIARRDLVDYVEIGSTGRYVNALKKHLRLRGRVTLAHELAPGMSPVDIVERGQIRPVGEYVPMRAFEPLSLPDASADLVSCFVGLHHMPTARLQPFLRAIARVLRPGGYFVVRDHDVTTPEMDQFVALAHTVFNAGLGERWETNQAEPRFFNSVQYWVEQIEAAGLRHTGDKLLQAGDPSQNVLMAFVKAESV